MLKAWRIRHARGQTTLETMAVLPLFMFFAFLALQLGHIGIGLAIVNYAASSIARQSVELNDYNAGMADMKFKKIVFAGLTDPVVHGSTNGDSQGEGTSNVTITTCAELSSFPMVAPFLSKVHTSQSVPPPGGCEGATKWFGPVGIKGAPTYHFLLQGRAVARMNYNAKG